jgi:3-dehydroquinate dehydratase I
MKIVVSVDSVDSIDDALQYDPTFIEVRLDMMDGDITEQIKALRAKTVIPLIATLRSKDEGGRFVGSPDLWIKVMGSIAKYADYVDVEARFRDHAPFIKSQGVQIIASLHTEEMPTRPELGKIESMLRSYGDIPKIVVKPRTQDDLFELVSFTFNAQKPICTGVMGTDFRYARIILSLFGSEFTFCHAGTPTAEGQYHIRECRQMADLL